MKRTLARDADENVAELSLPDTGAASMDHIRHAASTCDALRERKLQKADCGGTDEPAAHVRDDRCCDRNHHRGRAGHCPEQAFRTPAKSVWSRIRTDGPRNRQRSN